MNIPVRYPTFMHARTMASVATLLVALVASSAAAQTRSRWRFSASLEQGAPGGWVRVRENDIAGTRLRIHDDLHVNAMQTLRLGAWRQLSERSGLHLGFATSRLHGHAVIASPVDFNGTTVAPGVLDTTTHFRDFLAFEASYWRRLLGFGHGGALWGSIGADYVMLNFRMDGTIAAGSTGHELKEDFYVQELPIPTLGLHLRYPFADRWRLDADFKAGRLPWVNSFRTEGGEVRLAQTGMDASVGVVHALARHWDLKLYAFHHALVQSERSREDGNYIRLRTTGVGLRIERGF